MKLNRIGNKLGLVGAFGVVLAVGMVANQIVSEKKVTEATATADRYQSVAESALLAHVDLRQVQLRARKIRLARNVAEVDTSLGEMRGFDESGQKNAGAAYQSAVKPENKERFRKVKALMAEFSAGVDELGKVQKQALAQIDKRTEVSGGWTKEMDAMLASPVLARLDEREAIEKQLHRADAKLNLMRAQVWRFGATGDPSIPRRDRQDQGRGGGDPQAGRELVRRQGIPDGPFGTADDCRQVRRRQR